MKKLLTVLTVLTTIISYNSLYSQDKPVQEHLTFMGIPIDGNLSDFFEKMKNKNFTIVKRDNRNYRDYHNNESLFWIRYDDSTCLQGIFACRHVYVHIATTPKSRTVYRVLVCFDENCTNWPSLKENYIYYKKLLSSKYGKPQTSENISIPDSSKMRAMADKKCDYNSTWWLQNENYIQLSINCIDDYVDILHADEKKLLCGNTIITYANDINYKLMHQEFDLIRKERENKEMNDI